ncbi:hypothetical protein LTI14_10635 [Nesterenkonia sp. YGD6]|uniref:hypothetical protein n=1 Tax=Nesterenkonia sp. YGD6 TaxID=2901231 RepID=UPI001F4C576B|nr:hypothetical protein [Nesterenkonia sp. YGD6]MCH8563666.1 hypothetical protein [Nesterenkonia sp. YGD6]
MSIKETVISHAGALGPDLQDTMARAMASASRDISSLPHDKYPHLRPHITRAYWREELEKTTLPMGWTLGGNPRRNGQTSLIHPELNAEMRIMKERRRTYPGGVPTAGLSPSRRKYWDGTGTPPMEGLEIPAGSLPQFEPLNLLLCWDYATSENQTDFKLRVVHTLEPGHYGEAVKCDIIIDIQQDGGLHRYSRFEGSEDHEDFFNFDFRKEENAT